MDFFDEKESYDLFDQFEVEYQIKVDKEVIDEIFEYTSGYLYFYFILIS